MARIMKDSGVNWLNFIPADWTIKKWRHLMTERNEKNDKLEVKEVLSLGYHYGLIPASEKEYAGGNKAREDLSGYKIVRPNDIVMNSMNIICGSVDISKYTGCVSPVYYAFYTIDNEPRYYNYLLKTDQFERSLLGLGNGILIKETDDGKFVSVRLRIPVDKLKPLLLPQPTISEQQKIADFLDKKCSEIDSVLTKTRESIEEYKKLKQSIITRAVTKGIRPNRKMKNSGIEWIGEIPEDWSINYLSQLFEQVKNKNDGLKEKNLMSLSYGKIIRKNIDTTFGLLPESFEGYNVIEKDDIVLRLTDLQNDHKSLRVGLSKERGIITSAYLTIRIKNEVLANYYYYLLHTFDIEKGFYGMGAGVRQGLNWSEVRNLRLITPNSIEEQKEICSYLDKKCSEIDTLIAKKEDLIAELETYKKSLIYEYVTGKKEVK